MRGDLRRHGVGLATKHGGQGAGIGTGLLAVVGHSVYHQQRSQIGITQPQRPVIMAVAGNFLGGIGTEIHQDFHGGCEDADSRPVGIQIETAVGAAELHQVQGCQVARRVIEKHEFRAGIGSPYATGCGAGVPIVDGRIELQAGIGAAPRSLGDLAHDFAGLVGLVHLARSAQRGGPIAVFLIGLEEFFGHSNRVVGVLPRDGAVRLPVEIRVVASGDERLGLGFFLGFPANEIDDFGMVDIQANHFGGPPRRATGFGRTGALIEHLQEGHHTR